MPQIFDVSVPLREGMVVWPGDVTFRRDLCASTSRGEVCNLTACHLSSHTGTHLDAPFHFAPEGRRIHEVRPEELVGPCWVADLSGAEGHITADLLRSAGIPPFTGRLLLKTRSSQLWADPLGPFLEDYPALTPEAGQWVLDQGIRLLGVDYLSVDPYQSTGFEVHRLLLGADRLIVENLDLRATPPGAFELICLPLRVVDADGAPCRVLLRR